MSQEEGLLISAIAASEELELFTTDSVRDLLNYKWGSFAAVTHWFGWLIHMAYIFALQMYINEIYLRDDVEKLPDVHVWLWTIGGCLIYPLFYDGRQWLKLGWDYFNDPWNWLDMLHLTVGYSNLFFQQLLDPSNLACKLMMIVVVFTSLMKQFFFMRTVMKFSYIVTMIVNVVADLKVFLLFFLILILHFSMILNVIAPNDADEYKLIGKSAGNIMATLRLALGDFDFGVLEKPIE